MTYAFKVENSLPCVWRSKVWLAYCLGGNGNGEVVYKHLLTYYFENGRENHSMSIEFKGPSVFVICELFVGSHKIDLYRYKVPCKTLRVCRRRYLIR